MQLLVPPHYQTTKSQFHQPGLFCLTPAFLLPFLVISQPFLLLHVLVLSHALAPSQTVLSRLLWVAFPRADPTPWLDCVGRFPLVCCRLVDSLQTLLLRSTYCAHYHQHCSSLCGHSCLLSKGKEATICNYYKQKVQGKLTLE